MTEYAHQFEGGELTIGSNIYTKVKKVSFNQPTTTGRAPGTNVLPGDQSRGKLEEGEGEVEFSREDERQRCLDDLGDAWREKLSRITWLLTEDGKRPIKFVYFNCKIKEEPLDHESGGAPVGGPVKFTFDYYTRNGKSPHSGLPVSAG